MRPVYQSGREEKMTICIKKSIALLLGDGGMRKRWLPPVLVLFLAISGTIGEIDVSVRIPVAVAENSTVKMFCDYDLHSLPLYSVKWYKSQSEFYRFLPKELPHKKTFQPLSEKVDLDGSDDHHVVLNNVGSNLAGKYRCEVSTDSPSFITRMEGGYMHVIRAPHGNLTLLTEKPRYAVGDTVRGNCTAPPGNPAANLTWVVNGRKMNSSFTRQRPSNKRFYDNQMVSEAGLEIELSPESFSGGKLKVSCHADVYNVYKDHVSVILEEERPRLASVLGTRESSHSKTTTASMSWLLTLMLINFAIFVSR